MSGPSTLSNDSLARSSPEADAQPDAGLLSRSIKQPLQFVGFWTAIALPFVHIPLLVQGLHGFETTLAFLALVALNFVALVVGHGYNQH